jgi:hypothetical protein
LTLGHQIRRKCILLLPQLFDLVDLGQGAAVRDICIWGDNACGMAWDRVKVRQDHGRVQSWRYDLVCKWMGMVMGSTGARSTRSSIWTQLVTVWTFILGEWDSSDGGGGIVKAIGGAERRLGLVRVVADERMLGMAIVGIRLMMMIYSIDQGRRCWLLLMLVVVVAVILFHLRQVEDLTALKPAMQDGEPSHSRPVFRPINKSYKVRRLQNASTMCSPQPRFVLTVKCTGSVK